MVPILKFLRMWPAVRVDWPALGIIAMLRERCPRTVFGYGNGQMRMVRMRLVQHGAELRDWPDVPSKIAVVADSVRHPHDGFTGRHTDQVVAHMGWHAHLAAVGEGRGASGVFALRQFIQRF